MARSGWHLLTRSPQIVLAKLLAVAGTRVPFYSKTWWPAHSTFFSPSQVKWPSKLTDVERSEYETYVYVIDFIAILQAKARALLKRSQDA